MQIFQVSGCDFGGGAEAVARNLFQTYQKHGLQSWMAVGRKRSDNPNILLVSNDASRNKWARLWRSLGNKLLPFIGETRGVWQLRNLLYGIGNPQWWLDIRRGYEDFDFPGTRCILSLSPQGYPDIVHCHNLHGEYFDLKTLPWLSSQVPVLLTLHDAWLLSGHCAHSLECQRWKTGCGNCPDLKLYPAIQRDATAYNWQRKQNIFAKSKLYIATPSYWLMDKVKQSMLASAMLEARVINNGIDLSIFCAGNKQELRTNLDLPSDYKIILLTANNIRKNVWKDYETVQLAMTQLIERLLDQKMCFVVLGDKSISVEKLGHANIYYMGFQKDPRKVADFYRAADIYLHAARVDTFPNTVIESLACGTPVVATAVGGIPEQIKSLQTINGGNSYSPDEATGILVPPQDADGMSAAIEFLLTNGELCDQLGRNAATDARKRFDLDRQAQEYLEWYGEILESWRK